MTANIECLEAQNRSLRAEVARLSVAGLKGGSEGDVSRKEMFDLRDQLNTQKEENKQLKDPKGVIGRLQSQVAELSEENRFLKDKNAMENLLGDLERLKADNERLVQRFAEEKRGILSGAAESKLNLERRAAMQRVGKTMEQWLAGSVRGLLFRWQQKIPTEMTPEQREIQRLNRIVEQQQMQAQAPYQCPIPLRTTGKDEMLPFSSVCVTPFLCALTHACSWNCSQASSARH